MGNTQGVWILRVAVLILNFLIADRQTTAAKRHGVERGTAEISQPVCLRNALTLKWKSKNVFVKWSLKDALPGEEISFCSHRS